MFHFDHTNKATAGEEGTIWKIKQAETNPMESSTKMEEEITDEASMENSTATNKNVSDANPENSTKTAAEDEVSETSTENSSTRTAVEEEDPEPEEEYNEPAEDEASAEKSVLVQFTCAIFQKKNFIKIFAIKMINLAWNY